MTAIKKPAMPKPEGPALRITWGNLVLGVAQSFEADFTRKQLMAAIEPLAARYYSKNANWQQSVAQQLTNCVKNGTLERVQRGVYRAAA